MAKRHASQMERIRTNNLKNLHLIQKQIAANTTFTKNRLACNQNFASTCNSQRSRTVTSSRQNAYSNKALQRVLDQRDENNSHMQLT